ALRTCSLTQKGWAGESCRGRGDVAWGAGAAMRSARWTAVLLALLLAWLVGYPLLHAAREGFAGPGPLGALGEWMRRGEEWRALWRSLCISLASVAASAALGVPLAFFFARAEFPG